MNPAEHLIILVSIIIGLAVADLLTSFHHLVRARDRVRFHWLPMTWAGLIFLQLIQIWWVYFYVLQAEVWRNYFAYVFFLLVPVLLFLIACWVLPDRESDDGSPIDLKAYYLREHGWLFGLVSLGVAVQVASELLLGHAFLQPARLIQGSAFILFVSLAWTKNLRYHAGATLVLLGLFVSFAFVYTVRLV